MSSHEHPDRAEATHVGVVCDLCGETVDPARGWDVPEYYGQAEETCQSCWYQIKAGNDVSIDRDIIWHTAQTVDVTPSRIVNWLTKEDTLGHEIDLGWFQRAVVAEVQRRQQIRDDHS